jgi:hypothetical protein
MSLFFHFIGFGLLVTLNVAGIILNSQYKKAPDLQTKAIILRALKPIGMLSPIAVLLMLVTGIGNMHSLGLDLMSMAWLAYKIVFFAIAAISGVIFGIISRKRGTLVGSMIKGNAPANANELLQSYDKQIKIGYIVFPILMVIILCLSIYGRLGGQ